jgi:hypothetical protein
MQMPPADAPQVLLNGRSELVEMNRRDDRDLGHERIFGERGLLGVT